MKKLSLKSKFLLGAILMGGMVAGANTLVNMPSANQETYNWTGSAEAPLNPNGSLPASTVAQAEDHFGCAGEEDVCATGVPTSGIGPNATINLE